MSLAIPGSGWRRFDFAEHWAGAIANGWGRCAAFVVPASRRLGRNPTGETPVPQLRADRRDAGTTTQKCFATPADCLTLRSQQVSKHCLCRVVQGFQAADLVPLLQHQLAETAKEALRV